MSLNFNPPLGARLNGNHPINRGLISCRLLNEGGGQIAFELVSKNHATGVGSPTRTQTSFGGAMHFNGSTQTIKAIRAVVPPQTGYSFSLWLSKDSIDATTHAFRMDTAALYVFGFYTTGGNLNFRIYNPTVSGWIGRNVTGAFATAGKWYHVVLTWDGGTTASAVKIYLNGIQADNADNTGGTFSGPTTSATSIQIGGDPTDALFWDGSIANVREWNRPLSAQEARQLYIHPYVGVLQPYNRKLNSVGATPTPIPGNSTQFLQLMGIGT